MGFRYTESPAGSTHNPSLLRGKVERRAGCIDQEAISAQGKMPVPGPTQLFTASLISVKPIPSGSRVEETLLVSRESRRPYKER